MKRYMLNISIKDSINQINGWVHSERKKLWGQQHKKAWRSAEDKPELHWTSLINLSIHYNLFLVKQQMCGWAKNLRYRQHYHNIHIHKNNYCSLITVRTLENNNKGNHIPSVNRNGIQPRDINSNITEAIFRSCKHQTKTQHTKIHILLKRDLKESFA